MRLPDPACEIKPSMILHLDRQRRVGLDVVSELEARRLPCRDRTPAVIAQEGGDSALSTLPLRPLRRSHV
jgi:hypothetical protein